MKFSFEQELIANLNGFSLDSNSEQLFLDENNNYMDNEDTLTVSIVDEYNDVISEDIDIATKQEDSQTSAIQVTSGRQTGGDAFRSLYDLRPTINVTALHKELGVDQDVYKGNGDVLFKMSNGIGFVLAFFVIILIVVVTKLLIKKSK